MRKEYILILLLVIGCQLPTEPESSNKKLSADIEIVKVEQPYYGSLKKYGNATIYYNIKNTGNGEIDYYKVYFTLITTNGQSIKDWDNGSGVKVGSFISDYTIIDTMGYKYDSIKVDSKELSNYDL